MGPIRCPETSVNNYRTTPRNIPEDHRFYQYRGCSLKSTPNILSGLDTFVEIGNFPLIWDCFHGLQEDIIGGDVVLSCNM
jgi:hypothetical protein